MASNMELSPRATQQFVELLGTAVGGEGMVDQRLHGVQGFQPIAVANVVVGLGGLHQVQAQAVGDVLGQCFGQQACRQVLSGGRGVMVSSYRLRVIPIAPRRGASCRYCLL